MKYAILSIWVLSIVGCKSTGPRCADVKGTAINVDENKAGAIIYPARQEDERVICARFCLNPESLAAERLDNSSG